MVHKDHMQNIVVGDELPAGTNNIGDVDLGSELPAGTNEIGLVKVNPTPVGKTTLIKKGIAANSTATAHTVTAGKIFYLCACNLLYWSCADNESGYMNVGSDTILGMASHITAVYHVADSDAITVSFPVPLPIPAGTKLDVVSSAATIGVIGIFIGWEEDA